MRKFLKQLSYALRHVSNEYRSAALVGGNDYLVRVLVVGLERPESDRVFARVLAEAVTGEWPPKRDPDLEAHRESYIDATVTKASGPLAATTIVVDALRAALGEERLEHKVEAVRTQAVLAEEAA